MSAPRAWPVFLAYLLAFVTIVAFTIVAATVVRTLYPDLSERELYEGLPGLLAGGVASSAALIVTVLVVSRPFDPGRLRLRPGRETGRTLAAMIVGTLALGQLLDSLTMLAGLGAKGAMAVIRQAIESARGSELFAAVVIVGLLAGAAEEVFFRGYMQSRLSERWGPRLAVPVTSVAFGLLHLEWLHALLALALGLWLGIITERAGSALPAIVAHVVNNAVFTVMIATVGTVDSVRTNVLLAAAGGACFLACALVLTRDA